MRKSQLLIIVALFGLLLAINLLSGEHAGAKDFFGGLPWYGWAGLVGFLALGAAVAYVAFWGGPGGARQAYLTRGRRGFRIVIPILYIALGIAVPALVLANGKSGEGEQGPLQTTHGSKEFNKGKALFRQSCWSCHTLKAAGAEGTIGPNLDELKPGLEAAVEQVTNGGNGMPAFGDQLSQEDIQAVAAFVVASTQR